MGTSETNQRWQCGYLRAPSARWKSISCPGFERGFEHQSAALSWWLGKVLSFPSGHWATTGKICRLAAWTKIKRWKRKEKLVGGISKEKRKMKEQKMTRATLVKVNTVLPSSETVGLFKRGEAKSEAGGCEWSEHTTNFDEWKSLCGTAPYLHNYRRPNNSSDGLLSLHLFKKIYKMQYAADLLLLFYLSLRFGGYPAVVKRVYLLRMISFGHALFVALHPECKIINNHKSYFSNQAFGCFWCWEIV